MVRTQAHSNVTARGDLPPTSEVFTQTQLIERHPHILNACRVTWALRNRATNGLLAQGAVFESRGGELLVHEPRFLEWFFGLSGKAKPRAQRKSA